MEIKRTDDYWKFNRQDGVIDDRDKLQCVAAEALIDRYIGVLVCQDKGTPIRDTIKQLEVGLGSPVSIGEINRSKDGTGWEWAFVCSKVTPHQQQEVA